MVEVIWTEPALSDLDAIADYIALENPEAARSLVQRVFQHVEQLATYPESGSRPRELRGSRHRQIVEPPSRVCYRSDGERVFVLYVIRGGPRNGSSCMREVTVKPRQVTSNVRRQEVNQEILSYPARPKGGDHVESRRRTDPRPA